MKLIELKFDNKLLTVLLLLNVCTATVSAYKILIYNPQVWYSHVQYWSSIADTLSEAGHDVTVFVPRFFDSINATGIKQSKTIIRQRSFDLPYDENHLSMQAIRGQSHDPVAMISILQFLHLSQASLCNGTDSMNISDEIADQDLLNDLAAENFDLGMTDVYSTCGFALFHKIGLKTYITGFSSSLVEFVTIPFGIDNNPSYVPGALTALSDEMSYFERVQNVFTMLIERLLSLFFLPVEKYYAKLIPGFDLRTAVSKSAFVFVNTDEYIEFPRPINHKIIFVGGIAVAKPKPLPPIFYDVVTNADGDVVLVSFGSIVNGKDAVDNILNAFIGLFSSFRGVTFIWKYEDDNIGYRNLTNVVRRRWIPQNDLLNHPKVKALISHCGMNSLLESANAGKPLICIPLFSEEGRNARIVEKRGIGRTINKLHLNSKLLIEALNAVLYDPRYRNAAERLSSIIKSKPIPVTDRVIKHTEFAAKFSLINNLQPSCTQLNYFQYYLLDIIIPGIILLALLMCCFGIAMVRLARHVTYSIGYNKKKID
uniref:glucuronosyltransferase n=1 Tax=Syphacia muris TaxID=451379 RepID=A0A0N5ABX1_9BILA